MRLLSRSSSPHSLAGTPLSTLLLGLSFFFVASASPLASQSNSNSKANHSPRSRIKIVRDYPTENGTCNSIAQRHEWRTLSSTQQAEYISAVKCLSTKPSAIGLESSLYNDFPYIHSVLNSEIHFVAQFLPWHRAFVQIYEHTLRTNCSYTGYMPYWDWTLDSGKFLSSPLFSSSPDTGFGGNGLNGGFISPARPNPLTSCVLEGAFANNTLGLQYYSSVASPRPHCLNRGFTEEGSTGDPALDSNYSAGGYSPSLLKNITVQSTNFTTFATTLENGPHGTIHFTIGGDMIPSTSPNDPLFFLHHAQIDRLWWQWQNLNLSSRTTDFSGNKNARDGTPLAEAAELTDIMPFLGLGEDVSVKSVMVTGKESTSGLCYEYV